jgi:hypothetical protein
MILIIDTPSTSVAQRTSFGTRLAIPVDPRSTLLERVLFRGHPSLCSTGTLEVRDIVPVRYDSSRTGTYTRPFVLIRELRTTYVLILSPPKVRTYARRILF